MQEIHGDNNLLLDIVHNYPLIGRGGGYYVIDYNDDLIKIDKELYHLSRNKDFDSIKQYLSSLFFCFHYRVNIRQIRYLIKAQKNIKLTSLPRGILFINNVPCGVILKYHHDCLDLIDYQIYDYHNFLDIAKQILLRIKELDINGLYQHDLCARNVLYHSNRIELIDLDGPLFLTGYNESNRAYMYHEYLRLLKYLLKELSEDGSIDKINNIKEFNSNRCFKLLDELSKGRMYVK